MTKKILFIHHGGIAGGAPLSMLYTMLGLRERGYSPIVGLVNPLKELHKLYNENGFETHEMPDIVKFITCSGSEGKRINPVMWKGVYDAWKGWRNSKYQLAKFIKKEKVCLVHLNSVCLSNSAELCSEMNIPFVWHVREYGPKHRANRYRFIQKRLLKADNVIFLSKAEEESWLENKGSGIIVHNFIDFKKFDFTKTYQKPNINTKGKKVLLYVGGIKKYKGIITLLEALHLVKKTANIPFVCLMPDTYLSNFKSLNGLQLKVKREIENGLEDVCFQMPFNPNIVDLYAQSDILLFPAIEPHFARPVIEASAMKKPVIASNLKPMDELVINGKTGYLTKAGDSSELADRIIELMSDENMCNSMGESGYAFAKENFEFEKQIDKIEEIYKKALNDYQPK